MCVCGAGPGVGETVSAIWCVRKHSNQLFAFVYAAQPCQCLQNFVSYNWRGLLRQHVQQTRSLKTRPTPPSSHGVWFFIEHLCIACLHPSCAARAGRRLRFIREIPKREPENTVANITTSAWTTHWHIYHARSNPLRHSKLLTQDILSKLDHKFESHMSSLCQRGSAGGTEMSPLSVNT